MVKQILGQGIAQILLPYAGPTARQFQPKGLNSPRVFRKKIIPFGGIVCAPCALTTFSTTLQILPTVMLFVHGKGMGSSLIPGTLTHSTNTMKI